MVFAMQAILLLRLAVAASLSELRLSHPASWLNFQSEAEQHPKFSAPGVARSAFAFHGLAREPVGTVLRATLWDNVYKVTLPDFPCIQLFTARCISRSANFRKLLIYYNEPSSVMNGPRLAT